MALGARGFSKYSFDVLALLGGRPKKGVLLAGSVRFWRCVCLWAQEGADGSKQLNIALHTCASWHAYAAMLRSSITGRKSLGER